MRVVYPTAPSADVVGRTDVLSNVVDAKDTEDDVLVRTNSDDDVDVDVDSSDVVLDAVSLVTRDSLEEARDDKAED